MKFICLTCGDKFKESTNKKTKSLLVDSLIISCPTCDSKNISLTEKGKLLVDRKAKINKIKKLGQ